MNNNQLSTSPFVLDLHTRELFKDGVKVKVSGQPFEILTLLLRTPGELVTREEFRNQLWPQDTFVDFDHGLNAAINKLREALDDSPDAPRFIETLPRRGYRFIVQDTLQPQSIAQPIGVECREQFAGSHANDRLLRRGIFWDPVFLIALLAALILPATVRLSRVSSSTTHEPLPHIKPLTNLADETSNPAFSPNGELIAFHREGNPTASGIFVQSLNSGAVTQLTQNDHDYAPAWSPDGRSLAFGRFNDHGTVSLNLLSLDKPNAEHKIETPIAAKRPELTFSPDGTSIVYSSANGLTFLNLQNSAMHQLTEAPPQSIDWGPAFSPDGRTLLFVRSTKADYTDQLLTIPAHGGEPTQIASEHADMLGPPQWSADGGTIVFASNRGSHPGLWRVSAHLRDTPVQINDSGWYPAISRSTARLAYQRITRSLNIWELNSVSTNKKAKILVPATSETDQGPAPQISPDNKKLAYMSDRSGTMEIWISDRDGTNPRQLTSIGNVGTPRWSRDSQSIVFDANHGRGSSIYTIALSGSPPRLITPDETHNVCPSYSRDGNWIYFASHRSGEFEVWKVPSAGGTATQLTHHGGHAPLDSADGKTIYYAKTFLANPEIWQIPVNGGPEKLVSTQIRPPSWAAWSVTDKGIAYAAPSSSGKPVVQLFNINTHKVTELATLDIPPFWLAVSPDASTILFDQPGWQQAQIMLVDNFH